MFIKRIFFTLLRFFLRFENFQNFTIDIMDNFCYLLEDKYIIIDKGKIGYIPEDFFHPYNDKLKVVDITKHLIIEKGKFKFELINKHLVKFDEAPGMMTIDNQTQSYDNFWKNDKMLEHYLDKSRLEFFRSVFNISSKYLKGKIIDIGCGSGDFLKIIYDHHALDCKIHGIDFSNTSIQRCKKIIPDGNFSVKNIYHLDIGNNVFDAVICMEVLEHLEKPEIAFREIRRICKNDGIIIITIPNGYLDDYVGHVNFWGKKEFNDFIGNIELIDFHYLENKLSMLFILKNRRIPFLQR